MCLQITQVRKTKCPARFPHSSAPTGREMASVLGEFSQSLSEAPEKKREKKKDNLETRILFRRTPTSPAWGKDRHPRDSKVREMPAGETRTKVKTEPSCAEPAHTGLGDMGSQLSFYELRLSLAPSCVHTTTTH